MTYWKNKVVVITGGSAGLGLELARTLVQQQAAVALVARNKERLQDVCCELGSLAQAFPADVTSDEQIEQLGADVSKKFGRVDALINCAGKSTRGAILDATVDEFRELFEINFLSAVRCTRAFMPALAESKGHVIHVGSLASKSVSRFLGAYPASKFPLAAYSQQLRLELDNGVHVMLVCPGPISRADAGHRYDAANLPESARQPGAGVRLKGADPVWLSKRIIRSAERRQLELVVPAKARLLFIVSQISARLGDWLVTKMTR